MYAFIAQLRMPFAVFVRKYGRVIEQLMLDKGIKVLSGEDVYNL